ncbi:MAG TPA: FUSC family protein [Candidatus Sulfotelmatobacter sp.]|nr:FUSC family protein [Candidatus Sulfotelmatobacter sp.]
MTSDRVALIGWPVMEHSARTAAATVASVLVARLFRLPEAYWAPITTLVITQSSLGAALAVSWQRFIGTALGAVLGGILASCFGPHVLVFGTCVFVLGLLCATMRADRSAYRFGGVTLAIVLLVPHPQPGWKIAFSPLCRSVRRDRHGAPFRIDLVGEGSHSGRCEG